MGFLTGKRVLIFGVASNRSIAWGIAKAMHREGAELAFAYMGERLRERVEKLAGECDSDIVVLQVGKFLCVCFQLIQNALGNFLAACPDGPL